MLQVVSRKASVRWRSRSRSAGVRGLLRGPRLVGLDSGGGIRTRDLRVMRAFKGVRKTLICRALVILDDVTRGRICALLDVWETNYEVVADQRAAHPARLRRPGFGERLLRRPSAL